MDSSILQSMVFISILFHAFFATPHFNKEQEPCLYKLIIIYWPIVSGRTQGQVNKGGGQEKQFPWMVILTGGPLMGEAGGSERRLQGDA